MLHMLPGSILLPPCGGIDKAPLRLHPKLLHTLSDPLHGPDALQSQLTGARDSVIPRRKISEPSNFKLKLKGIFFSDIALFALEDIFSACQVSQNYQQALQHLLQYLQPCPCWSCRLSDPSRWSWLWESSRTAWTSSNGQK